MKTEIKKLKKYRIIKILFINIAVLLATLLVIFIIGETVMRIFFPNSVTPGYWPDASKVYVPELKRMLYCNVCNLTRSTAEYSYAINTNSEGFRDFHEVEKKEGVARILGLGDSFIFGNTIDYEDTVLYKLEEKLNKNLNYKVEAINLGCGGFSTAEEYVVYKKYGLKYKPDLVLLGFYINDFKGSIDYEKRAPYEKSSMRTIFSKSKFLNWIYWKVKISSLGNKVVTGLKLNIDQQDDYEFEMVLLNKDGYKNPLVKESIDYSFDFLKKIDDLSRSIGAKLIVFYIPSDYQIYKERLNKIKEMMNIKPIDLEVDYPQKILAEFLEKRQIIFLDFTKDFRSKKDKDLYWVYDRHLNKDGYSFLTDLLYERVKDEIKK